MDGRLKKVWGRRPPARELDVDLANLARAITSVMRRQAVASRIGIRDARYVRIQGRNIDSVVPKVEWEKVLPLLRDDDFYTQLVPVESSVQTVDSPVRLSSSTVEANDPLYQRVLGRIRLLFPTEVPT